MNSIVLGAALLVVAAAHLPAAVVVTTGTMSRTSSATAPVHRWSFTVTDPGAVAIDLLSWRMYPSFLDTHIFLFRHDSVLDSTDYIASNDDSGGTFGDGSSSTLDSYLSATLQSGRYLLTVMPCCGPVNTAISGVVYPAFFDPQLDYASTAQYQITWTGDVTNVEFVPEPASFLLCIPVLGILALRRRR